MKKQSKSLLGLLIGVIVLIGCMPAGPCMAKNNSMQINIEIGKKTFKATLYNNKTSRALLKNFPLSCKMSELNGNEKYKYLSYELPTNKKKVKRIKAGDIMLYGSDCLVVFYKSHKTSYKYTKVGHINNTRGLKKAVGKGKVKMKFTRIREQSDPNTTQESDSTEMPKPSPDVTVQPTVTPDVTVQPTVMPDDTEQILDDTENTLKLVEDVNPNETNPTTVPNQQANKKLMIKIGDKKVDVLWEENESVGALMDMCKDSPLEIQMSMYGGFEQVGSLGTNLPRNDSQTTTSSGDIVLYSGNQIVVFYGSNSWSYTRLGHITDQDNEGMAELLSQGDVTITISVE
ncbi:hypothetical protein SAMN02910400_00789 [Lachnospiraceae bacterium C10]|nr:hypothetical protein SAMN02910400_00789 [Lachnospiraceae bacterium C10]